MIEAGNIIKNLIPTEAVVVNKIQKLGAMYSLKFTGVNTNKSSSKVQFQGRSRKICIIRRSRTN